MLEATPKVPGYGRRLLSYCHCAVEPKVLRTNALIAALIGVVLSVANQFELIRAGVLSGRLLAKLAANFAIPFIVSTLSAVLNRPPQAGSQPE